MGPFGWSAEFTSEDVSDMLVQAGIGLDLPVMAQCLALALDTDREMVFKFGAREEQLHLDTTVEAPGICSDPMPFRLPPDGTMRTMGRPEADTILKRIVQLLVQHHRETDQRRLQLQAALQGASQRSAAFEGAARQLHAALGALLAERNPHLGISAAAATSLQHAGDGGGSAGTTPDGKRRRVDKDGSPGCQVRQPVARMGALWSQVGSQSPGGAPIHAALGSRESTQAAAAQGALLGRGGSGFAVGPSGGSQPFDFGATAAPAPAAAGAGSGAGGATAAAAVWAGRVPRNPSGVARAGSGGGGGAGGAGSGSGGGGAGNVRMKLSAAERAAYDAYRRVERSGLLLWHAPEHTTAWEAGGGDEGGPLRPGSVAEPPAQPVGPAADAQPVKGVDEASAAGGPQPALLEATQGLGVCSDAGAAGTLPADVAPAMAPTQEGAAAASSDAAEAAEAAAPQEPVPDRKVVAGSRRGGRGRGWRRY
ncbi:hypothetical protein MNEG_4823 [Monoraphidium neglectum]|uniref:Uncharacterized protein n=1 Tax=Monoraphidium neglectum TaxID=145388 RepID=A0A0D2JWV6_9CHLO|nr:hypothetical protein MNEG_4823 [Monoraphidium neglectum]KIZ03138.1 hypothetical protein MNEG_4823 [Monoraphidium neglectum]|eukprot:XP_013902157.1 hypothetical protein MNEG_4823 [Monoraphidium neglectum]